MQSKSIGKKKIYENIVRTIVNDFPSTSKLQQQERQQEQQQEQEQDQEKQQSLSSNITAQINSFYARGENLNNNNSMILARFFGITCLPFLTGNCNLNERCRLSHQFYSNSSLRSNLYRLSKFALEKVYKFMYNHEQLSKLYFSEFCALYVECGNFRKLLTMINDYQRYPMHSDCLYALYDGLIKCGLDKKFVCDSFLSLVHNESRIVKDVLVAIIAKANWTDLDY